MDQDMTFGAGRTHISEILRGALWRAHQLGTLGADLGKDMGGVMAQTVLVELQDNGYSTERPSRGRAAVVGEAIRTGNWGPVSDLDYAAWLNACKMDEIARSPLTLAEADRIIESGYEAHPRGEEAMALLVADWTGKLPGRDAA